MTPHQPPLRVGIVGCGAVTRECHLPALERLSSAEITVLCDRNETFASDARTQFGLKSTVTTRVEDLAGRTDAAIVAVPPRFHEPVTLQLLAMGADVFCEKPLAVTADEAQRMVDAAARAQRFLAVGLQMRFDANNALLRQVLQDSLLGEVREVVAETGSTMGWAMLTGAYYDKRQTGGGVFFDTGVHLVDRILWLFGDMTDIEFEDDSFGGLEANALLRGMLSVGGRPVPCTMAFSWTHPLSNCIRVVGSEGTAEVTFKDRDQLVLRRHVGGSEMVFTSKPSAPAPDSYHAQLADWVASCRDRREPFVTGASAVKALRLIEKAYSLRRRIPQLWVESFAPAA